MSTSEELKEELKTNGAKNGILVIRGREIGEMAEEVGVEREFLNREKGISVCRRKKGVWWEDVAGAVGLWQDEGKLVMLLVQRGSGDLSKAYSAEIEQSKASKHTDTRFKSFEDRLAEEMVAGQDVASILSDLVYERWVDYLLTDGVLRMGKRDVVETLKSLERNAETVRKQGAGDGGRRGTVTYTHWTDLTTRTTLRHSLILAPSSSSPFSASSTAYNNDEEESRKSPNERSLERVTYLGGLLLPLTVVASILAIEGDYGPEGSNFWVFWVASGLASLIAVGVIYIDQMRRMDVWVEGVVTGEDVGIFGEGMFGERNLEGRGMARRWKRGELGWKGAVKKASGLEKWWPSEGVRFKRPAVMERMGMDV